MFVLKPEQLVGQQMKNYQLVEFLSGGGFGYVYRAVHVKLHKKVAIKLLKPEHVPKKEHRAAFGREAKLIASFTHPHILDIYDYDVFDEIPFIVMPFIEQGSLRKLHPRHSILDRATILSYVRQIASALQYAHDHKIVHRDVKPDNFLRGPQGVLLSDFGIAIAAHSVNSLSPQDGIGTLFYMAPEQYEGQAQMWSDQYSLAVVIYEWLCGKVPFTGTTFYDCYRKHKEEAPPLFKQQGMDIPPAIEQAVRKGLAKDPYERFASIQDFATALEQAFLGQTVQISPIARTMPQAQEEPLLQAPPNDQRRNSFEQLWAEVMQSQVRGDNKRTFRLLRSILGRSDLTDSQKEVVEKQIRTLRQMIPVCMERIEKAAAEGRWKDEIGAWEDLLVLEPTREEIPERLSLNHYYPKEAIEERIRIACQNEAASWMYIQAEQMVREQKEAVARRQLEMLWESAPYYGDPAELGQKMGLSVPDTYKQALSKKLAEEREKGRREREEKRRKKEVERLKKEQEELEEKQKRERKMQVAEKRRKEQEQLELSRKRREESKYVNRMMVGGGCTGAVAGFVGGAIVVQNTSGEVAKNSVVAPAVAMIERLLALQMGLTHLDRWVAGGILGTIVFLLVGVLVGKWLGSSRKDKSDENDVGFSIGLTILVVAATCGAIIGGTTGQNGYWGLLTGAVVGIAIVILVLMGVFKLFGG